MASQDERDLCIQMEGTWACTDMEGLAQAKLGPVAQTPDRQTDRKADPDRPKAIRQGDTDSQTAPNSDRRRQADPDSLTDRPESGRHSAGHTDRAGARDPCIPGRPAGQL